MDFNGISGIDHGCKLLRGSREEEGPGANHGKQGGKKALAIHYVNFPFFIQFSVSAIMYSVC